MYPFTTAHKPEGPLSRSQYLPLSKEDVGEQLDWPRIYPRSSTRGSILMWKTAVLCELCIVIFFGGLFLKSNQTQTFPYYSPVNDIISYETRIFHSNRWNDPSPYQGRPSPELDEQWFSTYAATSFKITKEEERQLANRTSAVPGDPEHYITTLSVFRHLHCLNYIRKTMYPDYYTEFDLKNAKTLEHAENCIDVLREALMCSPDTTAGSVQWFPSIQTSKMTWDIAHTCVKYEDIQAWAASRAVYEYDDMVWVDGNPVHN